MCCFLSFGQKQVQQMFTFWASNVQDGRAPPKQNWVAH